MTSMDKVISRSPTTFTHLVHNELNKFLLVLYILIYFAKLFSGCDFSFVSVKRNPWYSDCYWYYLGTARQNFMMQKVFFYLSNKHVIFIETQSILSSSILLGFIYNFGKSKILRIVCKGIA